MAYYGRIVGLGMTENKKPLAVYGLTGRSPASKQRIAKVIGDKYIPSVNIEPIGKPSSQQMKQANLLFYNAIVAFSDLHEGDPYLAISNGCHTNHFADRTSAWPLKENSLDKALETMSYEPDSLRTARIAGEIIFHKKMHNCPVARIGIVTESQIGSTQFLLNPHDVGAGDGGVKIISTYSGKNDEKPTAPFWNGSIDDVLKTLPLEGTNAREVASDFYNKLDENYRVSAAAAVWTGKKWDIAVTNSSYCNNIENYV